MDQSKEKHLSRGSRKTDPCAKKGIGIIPFYLLPLSLREQLQYYKAMWTRALKENPISGQRNSIKAPGKMDNL